MKTKEFIRKVGELGFKAHKGVMQIDIVSDGLTVAIVSTKRIHVINSFCFVDVEWKNQDKLFDLIIEYAKTPIDERKEEKKYYLRHLYEKTFWRFPEDPRIDIWRDTADVEYMTPLIKYKDQFTLKEIEEIKEKFNTDLANFETIEVEEWK